MHLKVEVLELPSIQVLKMKLKIENIRLDEAKVIKKRVWLILQKRLFEYPGHISFTNITGKIMK